MRSIGVGRSSAPAGAGLVARAPGLEAARGEHAEASGEHRQELAGEADLLRRRIDPRGAGDGEGVAAVPAPGQRDPGGVERVGPFGARADREDRGAHRGLGEADAELAAEGGGPGPAGEHHGAGADRLPPR